MHQSARSDGIALPFSQVGIFPETPREDPELGLYAMRLVLSCRVTAGPRDDLSYLMGMGICGGEGGVEVENLGRY